MEMEMDECVTGVSAEEHLGSYRHHLGLGPLKFLVKIQCNRGSCK